MTDSKQRFYFKSDENQKAKEDFAAETGNDFISGEEFRAQTAGSFQDSLTNMLAWIREKKAKADEMPSKEELHQEPTGVTSLGSNLLDKATLGTSLPDLGVEASFENSSSENSLVSNLDQDSFNQDCDFPGFTAEELEASQQAVADDILNYMFKLGTDGQPLDLDTDIQSTFVHPSFVQRGDIYTSPFSTKDETEDTAERETASATDMLAWVKAMQEKSKK